VFKMYLDDSEKSFLLSAKRIGDSFYISQYEAFPDVSLVDMMIPPPKHYLIEGGCHMSSFHVIVVPPIYPPCRVSKRFRIATTVLYSGMTMPPVTLTMK